MFWASQITFCFEWYKEAWYSFYLVWFFRYFTLSKALFARWQRACYFVFERARIAYQGNFSLVKGTLWGNCKFLLEHFKGTKAMTNGGMEAIALIASVTYQASGNKHGERVHGPKNAMFTGSVKCTSALHKHGSRVFFWLWSRPTEKHTNGNVEFVFFSKITWLLLKIYLSYLFPNAKHHAWFLYYFQAWKFIFERAMPFCKIFGI